MQELVDDASFVLAGLPTRGDRRQARLQRSKAKNRSRALKKVVEQAKENSPSTETPGAEKTSSVKEIKINVVEASPAQAWLFSYMLVSLIAPSSGLFSGAVALSAILYIVN